MLLQIPSASSAHMRLSPDYRNRIRHAHDPYTEFQVRNRDKLLQLYWKSGRNQFKLDWVSLSAKSKSSYLQASCFFVDVYLPWRELSDGEALIVHILDYGYQSQDYIACLIL